ncbi:MAG: tetratricopeptide repeat protein, partial [Candidatus Acidiferrales bacterium]
MTLRRLRAGLLILSASIVCALALASSTDAQSQLKPSSAEDHLKRGNELRSKKDWDAAIAEYREALRLNPKNADAHRVLGAALRDKGD